MRLWLRGLVLQALRSTRGVCGPRGQPPPLPVPQKIVATWEAINLGRQPVPEYFNFARDVLDVWTQLEKVKIYNYVLGGGVLWGEEEEKQKIGNRC
uniref:Uncharacterized protein n=1 Tax=Equus asinus TaxID=9793 RepID=A0A9L0JWK7_EQUAS